MINVGIMQGRLVPPFEERFQTFPADQWRDEFGFAREAGLSCIEWIYEKHHEDDNPLKTDDGIAELKQLSHDTGVLVRSVCADYYMTEFLLDDEGRQNTENCNHLRELIHQASKLSIHYIVLPFVDASSLKSKAARNGVVELLKDIAPLAKNAKVELHLETDLEPVIFREILDQVGHEMVRANYDIGNSASLGFDPHEELTLLAPYLGSVHVKDRELRGSTVPLGFGNAHFRICFQMIRQAGFDGHYILQAARGENGDEVQLAIANRHFVEQGVVQNKEGTG